MNCEEYVVKKLINMEAEVNDKNNYIKALNLALDKANERINRLEELIGTRTRYSTYVASDGERTLSFDEPWSINEKDDYDLMVELMNKYNVEEEE